MVLELVAGKPFNGVHVFDNFVRLFIIFIGFTLALVCVRFAWLSIRNGERFRAYGILSYGLIVLTPALTGALRFPAPLTWWTTVTYFAGLILGLMALRLSYTANPDWRRLRTADLLRRRQRDNEDIARDRARRREDRERATTRATEDKADRESRRARRH